jgi:hypothetical protein
MPLKPASPSSVEDVQKSFFRRGWTWFQLRSRITQTFLALGLVAALFILARLQLLSERAQRLSQILVPVDIPFLDPHQPVVPIDLRFTIEDRLTGIRQGRLGDVVASGERIGLEFEAGSAAWVTVFGIDSKGIHPIFGKDLNPRFVEKGEPYRREITLDSTVGPEVYYAIAAAREFDFSEDLRPHLKTLFPEGRIKGPRFSAYELRLPEKLSQDLIYFEHVAAP